jgi:predicted secreted hydrolase
MLVGGTGNTGIKQPSDMKYVSLTRCRVSGSITTPGQQAEGASGIGWFDHQWGNSWTAQKYGWDWWGIQLLDGTDVLVFQQRDLNTGKTFFPLATFEDEHGHVTVTKKIDFAPDMRALWRSRKTSIVYPLRWKLSFPELKETIWVAPDVHDQEIRVLYGGGSIWEGSCKATAMVHGGKGIKGMAYMELVGYGAPKARKDLDSRMKLLEGGQ